MALVTWDKSFSVSVEKFDKQHQQLFDLLNALHDAMRQGQGQKMVEDAVHQLKTYTITHFRAEEELLRKTGFPGLAAHQAEHQNFAAQVSQFLEQMRSGQITSAMTILTFIKIGWRSTSCRATEPMAPI
jgi:hemerythrin-like metal-binding protein